MLLVAVANITLAAAAPCGGSAAVTTNKADYGPFETALISGSGFDCGQLLSVLITAPDGTTRSGTRTGSPGPDSVTTDGNGAFALNYSLSGTLPGGGGYRGQEGPYLVSVRSSSGSVLATATFTDGVGYQHFCAVTTNHYVQCWGWNLNGQLGNGTTTYSPIPVGVPVVTDVLQIGVGITHTCSWATAKSTAGATINKAKWVMARPISTTSSPRLV